MDMALIELKTWPEPFQATLEERKRFEFRNNDRGFIIGDTLLLREWNDLTRKYTGRELLVKVTYILHRGFGLPEGYCVLSVDIVEKPEADTRTTRLIAERGGP
jgi:hypothetical protein